MDAAELKRLYEEHIAKLGAEYGRVLAEHGWDGVMLHSGTPKIRSMFDDQYWPLRATPHYQHWVPLAHPECGVLVQPGKKPVLYKNAKVDFWEQPMEPDSDHFWSSFEVVELDDPDLVKEVRPQGKIAIIAEEPARARSWGFDETDRNPAALLKALDKLRVRKTAYELACLREANRRTAQGHRAVLEAFRKGDHSELDLHLSFLGATGQDDAETPYKNIVALGEHAATLHHVGYSRRREGAQALLLDAGATYQGYAADVTRTAWKGSGEGVELFGELVARLERLQQEICRRVKPGIPYQQLHNEAHELLAPVLRDLGISKASDAELVEKGITRKFLPHGLGHSLGLQTHDVGCADVRPEARNPFLRNTSIVEEEQVFTIEPGCYFIEPLLASLRSEGAPIDWKVVERLKRFGGVRIEDDLVVTKDGAVNLTREFLPT